MKKLLPFLLVCSLWACRKQMITPDDNSSIRVQHLQTVLKDSLSKEDWAVLDWQQVKTYQLPSGNHYFVRIGFIGQPATLDFILVEMEPGDKILQGKIIHLERTPAATTGSIRIHTLDRSAWVERPLAQGRPLQKQAPLNDGILISPFSLPSNAYSEWLPEVIVVGYTGSSSTMDMYNFQSFFNMMNSNSGNGGAYYGSAGGSGTGYPSAGGGGSRGSGGGGNPTSPNEPPEDMLELEPEYTDLIASIDIRKYFNCFDQVPSAGASYSIQLCTDLPINSNAEASARLLGGVSPGHTFLVVNKTNGSQSVTQSFGFYPEQQPSLWDPYAAVKSSLKNNGGAEINASITMNITEEEFNVVKQRAIGNSTHPYFLGEYNCSDYALSVFNSIRSNALPVNTFVGQIPPVPGMLLNPTTFIMRHAPQTVFLALQDIKNSNSPESGNVKIDVSHNFRAPVSHGECN